MSPRFLSLCVAALLLPISSIRVFGAEAADLTRNARPPKDDADLRFWLENMVWHHRFTMDEIRVATGLTAGEIEAAQTRFGITQNTRPARVDDTLKALPYPGGRHPRTGFLDGAIDPQRETKVSVFTPWDDASYVVVDVPEAIWCQSGLLYLAHTHVPTLWTKQNVTLPHQEWRRLADGTLESERVLPNAVAFGTRVAVERDAVHFEMWLRNGSEETLTDLRVQNCVMLKAAHGFTAQTNENKRLENPFAIVRSSIGDRWIITAWERCQRAWANPPVPCLHSDPQFPDCAPGQTARLRGWLWFYEGNAIDAELARLKALMSAPDK
jgi:hypothetical protein